MGPCGGTSVSKRALRNLSSLLGLTPFRGSLTGHFLFFGELLWASIWAGASVLNCPAPLTHPSDQKFVKAGQRWQLGVRQEEERWPASQ